MNNNDGKTDAKTDFQSDLIQLEVLQKEYDATLQRYENEKKRIISQWKDASGSGYTPTYSENIKCSSNHFCVNVVDNKAICYGDDAGCLWNTNDCNTDADCAKYNDQSPKYSDSDCSAMQATLASDTADEQATYEATRGWQLETCTISQTSSQDTKMIKALNTKLIELSTQIQAKIKSMNTTFVATSQTKNDDFTKIVTQYGQLLQERKNIINALNDHQYLDETNAQNEIFADQSNTHYILWLYIAHLIVVYLFILFVYPNLNVNIFTILVGTSLVFFFLICTMYLYIPQVFLMWMILVASIILYLRVFKK
jgi:hypothetical protein